jgi:hypothetical protein
MQLAICIAICMIIAYIWGDRGLNVLGWIMVLIPAGLIAFFFYFFVLPSRFWANL